MTVLLFVVLVLVLAAEFVNGWHDASNAIATVVSTRVLSPRVAVPMATVFNAVGAFSGTAVAATIGKGIVDPQAINLVTVASAMVAIVVWEVFTWYYGCRRARVTRSWQGFPAPASQPAEPGF